MRILLVFLFATGTIYANTDLKWVDEQIDAIKPKRTGIDSNYITALRDPVYVIPKELKDTSSKSPGTSITTSSPEAYKKPVKPLALEAVMNGSAYISGNWYKLNDKVRNKTISYINDDYVILSSKKSDIRLFVHQKNNKIKITTR